MNISIFTEVKSKTDPNKTYPLSLDRFGRWRCGCPDFQYRSAKDRNHKCKHILEHLEKLAKLERILRQKE